MATFACAGCGGEKATLATFTGTWQAHARTLKIARTGNGREWISLGLGHFVIDLRFKLSQPKGTPDDATARATVTAVRPRQRLCPLLLTHAANRKTNRSKSSLPAQRAGLRPGVELETSGLTIILTMVYNMVR